MIDKFAKSLGDISSDNRIKYRELHRDEKVLGVLKQASTMFSNNSPEGVHDYIANKIMSDFGVKRNETKISIKIGKSEDDKIINASGVVAVRIGGVIAEVPFSITNGEMSDFSTMTVGKQKLPYNKTVVAKLKSAYKNEEKKRSPYIGTAKTVNHNTDAGFLSEVNDIRENTLRKNNGADVGRARYVFASNELDNMLEKLSSIKEVRLEAVENHVEDYIKNTYAQAFNKVASIDVDEEISHVRDIYKKIEQLPLESVKKLKTGTKILFPERNGKEISMTSGVVFTDVKEYRDRDSYFDGKKRRIDKKYYETPEAIVVSHDGRVAVLYKNDDFLALPDKNSRFNIPSLKLKSLTSGELCIPVVGNKVYLPIQMTFTKDKFFYDKKHVSTYGIELPSNEGTYFPGYKHLTQLLGDEHPLRSFSYITKRAADAEEYPRHGSFIIFPGGKFESSASEIGTQMFKKLFGDDMASYLEFRTESNYNFRDCDSFLVDGETKCIKLKGFITGYIKNKKELMPVNNSMLKFAADKLYVKAVDTDRNVYSVQTSGSNKRNFGKGLSKGEVKRIMKGLGYSTAEIGEMLYHIEKQGTYSKDLPLNAKLNDLYNGKIEKKKDGVIKNIASRSFDKNKLKQALTDLNIEYAGTIMGELASESGIIDGALEAISKLANDSEGCAKLFEKLAIEHRNHDLQNAAKMCVVANRIAKFATETANSEQLLRGVGEAFGSIEKKAECFENVCTNLFEILEAQQTTQKEIVPTTLIKTAAESAQMALDLSYYIYKQATSAAMQDIVCEECGEEVNYPLKNGKCQKCVQKSTDEIDEDTKKKKDESYDSRNKKDIGEEDTTSPL